MSSLSVPVSGNEVGRDCAWCHILINFSLPHLLTKLFFFLLSCSKMSEVESNPPDEEKKPINSFYDATSYNLNGDYFDNQVISQHFWYLVSQHSDKI